MSCPRCGYQSPSSGEFCRKCGAPIDGSAAIPRSYADIKSENDRLKGEIGSLRHSLGEVVKQQTATSEILRVIRNSPTDVQLVFDAIAARAMELCHASSSGVPDSMARSSTLSPSVT